MNISNDSGGVESRHAVSHHEQRTKTREAMKSEDSFAIRAIAQRNRVALSRGNVRPAVALFLLCLLLTSCAQHSPAAKVSVQINVSLMPPATVLP